MKIQNQAFLALLLPFVAGLCVANQCAIARDFVDLNGPWRFAIDPSRSGEQYGWQQPSLNTGTWTQVQVPHCWTVDLRYPYTGTAWYRRNFSLPARGEGKQARIVFAGVFYRTKVWLNGQPIGEHEGGYTPFEFDVTSQVLGQGENTLAVEVSNSWDTNTLPGARIGPRPHDQVYPWFEYGGIVRPVTLVLTGPVYVANQRVTATPNLPEGTATVEAVAYVANKSHQPAKVRLGFSIARLNEKQCEQSLEAEVPPGATVPLTARAVLSREQVTLWDVDQPHLYALQTRLWRDGGTSAAAADEPLPVAFGIRKVEALRGSLLLNGIPIRMGGGNRHADHPRFGSLDPPEVIETDMSQMKRANMELCRISHYPVSGLLLDWADRNGLLIIEEGPNWQLTEGQMDSPALRRKFQSQMREMIERDWNHPSVIGWSVGNEYPSDTPAGLRWTKDMVEWVRSLDRSRLLTFASDRAGSPKIASPEGEGSQYSDLVCVNIYKDYAEKLDRIHALWPDKPVMLSEFAAADHVNLSAGEYNAYFLELAKVFRSRPYVVGASVWTYNDYRSRYPGTSADGYRHYGAVNAERQPKPAYNLLASEFSPALICEGRAAWDPAAEGILVSAAIRCRADFPAYPLRGYSVRCRVLGGAREVLVTQSIALPLLQPGDEFPLKAIFKLPPSASPAQVRMEVVRPTGFVTRSQDVPVAP